MKGSGGKTARGGAGVCGRDGEAAHKDVAALDVQVAEPAAVEEHERAPELGEDAPQGVHHVPGARRERAAVRVHVHLVGREHELAQRRREPHQ
ncbi:hypothetical protein EG860_15930, partial [Enterococcus faecalis]